MVGFGTEDPGLGTVEPGLGTVVVVLAAEEAFPVVDPGRGIATAGFGVPTGRGAACG